MAEHTITYTNTKSHLVHFSFTHSLRQPVVRIMFALPIIFLAWQLFQLVEHRQYPMFLKIAIVVGGVLIAVIFILGLHLAMSSFLFMGRGKNPGVLTAHTVTLNENGVSETTPAGSSNQNWKSILEVRRTANFILIYTQRHAAHLIPLNAFPSRQAAHDFYNFAQSAFMKSM
jgi:YcxB-like protein